MTVGIKERYKIRYVDGRIYTVTARGYPSAKVEFVSRYQGQLPLARGQRLVVWPMGRTHESRNMRI
ncbi:MAG: hypothetical protein R3322_00045 [Kiloniellales bacterium]|nr:hypothetical protein [Kiloniellales bacterium]